MLKYFFIKFEANYYLILFDFVEVQS